MATKNPRATSKPKPQAKNTSAPTKPGNSADVSATEAAQVASHANLPAAGQPTSEIKVASPEGGTVAAEQREPESAPLENIEITALRITSEVDGFRRAGRAWSQKPTTVPIEDLSEADIEALIREPLLDVAFVGANGEKIAV